MFDFEEGDVATQDVNIHYYRTGGDKPCLVLLHGFSDNGLCWQRVSERLHDRYDVVMLDARNHGKSDRQAATDRALSDDVARLIETLGLGPVRVLGHSMGASTAARLAAENPHLVSKLLLEDPPWRLNTIVESEQEIQKRNAGAEKWLGSMAKMDLQALIQFGVKQHPNWHEDDFPAWAESKQQVAATAMSGLNLAEWRELIDAINCPSLLIHTDGQRDGLLKQAVVDEICSTHDNFESACITDAGHNTRREQFDQYMVAVEAFLAQ